jgi:acyl carrier protein
MTQYQQYLDFMLSALKERAGAGVALSETTRLVADIGLSSLEVMEFVEKIEDHFDISIPLNILPDINTLGDLARRLQELDS